MFQEDQDARYAAMKDLENWNLRLKIKKIDMRNTEAAKAIVRKMGWPTFDMIGKRASHAFWLIVQHSDLERRFQAKCLKLLEAAVAKKQAHAKDFALLTDRVLVAQGKKQLFGTQFRREGDSLVPQPIRDRKGLEARRKAYGLESFAANLLKMARRSKKLGISPKKASGRD